MRGACGDDGGLIVQYIFELQSLGIGQLRHGRGRGYGELVLSGIAAGDAVGAWVRVWWQMY